MNARQRRELTILIALVIAVFLVYYLSTAFGQRQATEVVVTPGKPVNIKHRGELAKVGDISIKAGDLDKRVEQFLKNDPNREKDSKGVQFLMIRMSIFQDLVDRAIMTQEASKRKITVTDKEVDVAMSEIVNKFGSKEKLQENLATKHGFTIDVLREYLLSNLLEQKLYDDVTRGVKIDEAKYKADYEAMKVEWAKKKIETIDTPDEFRAKYLTRLRSEKFRDWKMGLRGQYKIQYFDPSLEPTEIAENMPNPHGGLTTPGGRAPQVSTKGPGGAGTAGGTKEQPNASDKGSSGEKPKTEQKPTK